MRQAPEDFCGPSRTGGWRCARPADAASLPFTGGWLLFLGYELAEEVEPRLRLPPSADPVVALAIRAPAAWVRDRRSGRGWVVAEPGYEHLLERLAEDVRRAAGNARCRAAAHRGATRKTPRGFCTRSRARSSTSPPAMCIRPTCRGAGRAAAAPPIDPAAVYGRLRAANPSPFAALMREGDFAVISSSPERLLCVRAGTVSTRPIAGTRPRGASPERDAALIDTLLGNEKERAEHVMLIDLERNDLGRICAGGSVRVDEYMAVESYAHVHHIVSNVSGLLREGVTPIQAIRALFPGGTITGCPKIRCMEIIAELEGTGRGAYTGAIGYLNRDGSCDLNILIRTISARGATLHVSGRRRHRRGLESGRGTGRDARQGQRAAARIGDAHMSTWINGRSRTTIDHRDRGLQYGDGLFETMRVRRRRIRLLDYHLERLYQGCRRLKIDPPAAEDAAR